jgi:hypothetical protein
MPQCVIPLPNVSTARSERRSFIGGSDARIIMGAEAEPKDLSGRPDPSQPRDYAGAKPSASPVRAAHAEFVAALAAHPPRTPLDADALDLEDRADHLNQVLSAMSVYVAVILDDTAQNVPGTLDLPNIEAVLADIASDVTGTIQQAAEGMVGRGA